MSLESGQAGTIMSKHQAGPAHVAYLDSVRGLAALTVIGSHYVNSYDLPCRSDFCNRLLSDFPLHVFWDGAAAVSLFFVLSGLVLSLRHFRHGAAPDLSRFHLGEYFIMRVCRIWLPYLAVLCLSAVLYRHYQAVSGGWPATIPKQNEWLPSLWGRPAGWGEFFQDSFLLGMRKEMVYVPQAWTLCIELALSLLVPVGVMVAARSSLWLALFTLFAIHPLGVSPALLHFMLGILLAKHHGRLAPWLAGQVYARRGLALLGFLLYTIGETQGDRIDADLLGGLTGLGAGLLLLYAFASARLQRVLSYSGFRYVGKVSYSIYLIHFAVLVNATPGFLAWLDASPSGLVPAWWGGLLAVILTSVVCAAFSYRFIEVPSMALGKRLGRWIRAWGV